MVNYFYTTLENQYRSDGTFGLLYDHFTDKSQAEAKYYTICAAAAVSDIPYHSAHLLRSDGIMIEGHVWDRRVEPAPDPIPPLNPSEDDEGE